MSTVHRGLYTLNSEELPIWANNVVRWLAWEKAVVQAQREREAKAQEEIDRMSWWQRLIRGNPRVNYAPSWFLANPFPQPSADDLEKFEHEYPDMAKEWS